MSLHIDAATEADSAALVGLVNQAYRPTAGQEGWTHESALVDGDRIAIDQVQALQRPGSAVLVAR